MSEEDKVKHILKGIEDDLEKEKQEAIRQVERVMDQLQAIDVEVNE